MNIIQIVGAVEIGLIYAFVAIGVYITFKIIDFPDLTVDGSFTLGASVATAMIFSGYNPYLSTATAIVTGMLAGIATGYLNVRWKILNLLAGILNMTALYSINLRIMGRPNIAIIDSPTIFGNFSIIYYLLALLIMITLLVNRFFMSDFGLAIRSVGINSKISSAYGINEGIMKIVALSISNGIVALSGALFAQSQGFSDITMGTGTIIVGLASVIIGDAILHPRNILLALVTCIMGSILYRISVAFALNTQILGLEASDLNLITSLLVALTMMMTRFRKQISTRRI